MRDLGDLVVDGLLWGPFKTIAQAPPLQNAII